MTAESRNELDREDEWVLGALARVPTHVVYRDFVNETVVLNLATGTYHGLNRVAGLMLAALDSASSVHEAAARLAEENGWDSDRVLRDMTELCRKLLDVGLIELKTEAPRAAD